MLVFIFTLIIVVTLVFLFTPNPLIKKIHHGEPLKLNKKKIKRVMLGMNFTDGLVYKIILYALLIIVSFIFLYPVIYMLLTAVKPQMDLADSAAGLYLLKRKRIQMVLILVIIRMHLKNCHILNHFINQCL